MLDFLKDGTCCGCSACLAACPVSCIVMKENEEGFLYPQAGESCIDCGLCERVCPVVQKQARDMVSGRIESKAAVGVTKTRKIWKASSSGGAFTEICRAFGNDTVIFGAAFEGKKVVHKAVNGVREIGILRKSKYVQSDMRDNFSMVRELLNQERSVVFSGTPCQVAGLRAYLQKDYERLLCIDFVCHGVGSPKVFEAALKELEQEFESEMLSYGFRAKKGKVGNYDRYTARYEFKNGRVHYRTEDAYHRLFLKQLCLRKSCAEHCRFRTQNRQGDITVADFSQKEKVLKHRMDSKNYSALVFNTEKGEQLAARLHKNMRLYPCSLELIKEDNPLFYRQCEGNPKRDLFFQDFCSGDALADLVKKFVPDRGKTRKDKLKNWIPYPIRWMHGKADAMLRRKRYGKKR